MKNIFLSLVAVAAMFAACSQDDENVTPVNVEDKGILEFGASLPSTRTYLNGNDVYWSEGDKLTVWSDDIQSPRTYVLSSGADSNTATFTYTPTAEIPTGVSGNAFYAIYPQSPKTLVSGDVAYIELPATQKCQDINKTKNFLPTYNPMAAMTTGDLNGMQFKNLCGIVVVDVTPDQDLNLTKIVLETPDAKALCGPATVTMAETPSMTMTEASGAYQEVTLACENMALTAGVKYSFYIVVPAATYNDFGIKIYTNKKRNEPSLYKIRKNKPLVLNAGEITTVGANFSLITVEPVPPHTYAVGDVYPFEGTPEGIVFAIDNTDGTQGRMISLKSVSGTYNYYTGPIDNDINADAFTGSLTDGLANLNGAIAANSELTQFPALKAVTALGEGWYIPASNELRTICDNYTELNNKWRATNNITDRTVNMMSGSNYCSSTVTGIFPYYDVEYVKQNRAKWDSASAYVEATDPAYSILPISRFESK